MVRADAQSRIGFRRTLLPYGGRAGSGSGMIYSDDLLVQVQSAHFQEGDWERAMCYTVLTLKNEMIDSVYAYTSAVVFTDNE